MKIAYVTSGAAGMFCGSCMRDNTLAAALCKLGHDALLIPTYTPIRTDETDVSERRVFFGGVNVFLQEKSRLFRYTPRFLDRLWDAPRLLRWVSRFAVKTKADQLGPMTVSMLQGDRGRQRKEVARLVRYLTADFRPDAIFLSNLLISGFVPTLKKETATPVFGVLQGDDIFLDALPEADRKRCIDLIRQNARSFDGFICTSRYYADAMAEYLGIDRTRMHVVHPGINPAGHTDATAERTVRTGPPYTIGYFARICPEKGFHQLVEAFGRMCRQSPGTEYRLKVSGWLGENYRPFFDEQWAKLAGDGWADRMEHVDSPNHADKVRFLSTIDVLCVPTVYREPKGLYVLESLLNGTPVVQPRHGSFPELIEATGGGRLVEPGDPQALADELQRFLADPPARQRAADAGRRAVRELFTAERMALATLAVLEQTVRSASSAGR